MDTIYLDHVAEDALSHSEAFRRLYAAPLPEDPIKQRGDVYARMRVYLAIHRNGAEPGPQDSLDKPVPIAGLSSIDDYVIARELYESGIALSMEPATTQGHLYQKRELLSLVRTFLYGRDYVKIPSDTGRPNATVRDRSHVSEAQVHALLHGSKKGHKGGDLGKLGHMVTAYRSEHSL